MNNNWNSQLDSPASGALEITPSDSAELSIYSRAIFIGVGGNIKLTLLNGNIVVFRQIPDAFILPVRVKQIHQTDTTATNIVALW